MVSTRTGSDEFEHQIEEAVERSLVEGSRRFGHLLAAAINGVMLWVVHQLLDWEWPGFLTPEFDQLLPLLTISFAAGVAINLVFVVNHAWPVKPLGELVNAVIGFALAWRTWQVFPFEFDDRAWSVLARFVLVVVLFGTAVGAVTHLARLIRPRPDAGS